MNTNRPLIIYVMGVSGVGKTTIASLLSKQLSIPYFDGDDYHSDHNIKKMAAGHPLNDEDRYHWLKNLNNLAKEYVTKNGCIIACSALKEKYRDILSDKIEKNVKWLFLNGDFELIRKRLQARKGHYMPVDLLKSQFSTLEPPVNALEVNIKNTPEEILKIVNREIFHKSEFGVAGLGVMGKSLSRNLASKGFDISIYNRYLKGVEENVAVNFKNKYPELQSAKPYQTIHDFVESLQQPRKILLMVNAGKAVDIVINELIPYLSENDTIIDGGNSHYHDTSRRIEALEKKKINYIGAGISGGEEGALYGPSIMPGGDAQAYKIISPFLESMAAKDKNGKPCCTYIGKNGSGHFTKMIHNGIEYAEMQLLAEAYHLLKSSGKNPDEIAGVFKSWKNDVPGYLLEITIDILYKKENDFWLIDKILDKAGNKGTGNWATIASAQLGVPGTMIASALFARYVSSFKETRLKMSELYSYKYSHLDIDTGELLKAYKLARIINHAQGFILLSEASENYEWNLNLSEIARIWTNGCIIRSGLMEELISILKTHENLMIHEKMIAEIKKLKKSLSLVVSESVIAGIPVPCLSEAVNFLNAYTQPNSSANLIQAQRDYFGAHTYQRTDKPEGEFYHTIWKNLSQ
ncbi:NADP-dependent phosphogluconate dehydrogenase [Abyssalbus ytuae]|uniref:6-phosphogluconate dehydrogenase, decarboxylating n=1 Tax=Abyssalbus ytuae TaxID=2926907 RepID=A0A9E6ZMY8_9FLAO|nr:NADP-dependent phosphogluconate dehydrogenase [Abyssalbus ytuae]UOB17659.1 NADP-dependent phosphogluconate dehydrogenase [Abyssalbus ytuae]